MPETCKIEGAIEEVEKLIRESETNSSNLKNRLEELKKEKNKLSDTPLNKLRQVFGESENMVFMNNGEFSPQVTIHRNGKTFYRFGLDPLIEYPLRGIEISDTEVRLCFTSKPKIS